MFLARTSSTRRAAAAVAAVLIAGLCAVVAHAATPAAPPALPGPHNEQQSSADGRAAGPQQSNIPGAAKAASGTAVPAAAPGAGARVPGFVSLHVYATQYDPNTPGSFEVAVPDECVKFAALGITPPSGVNCGGGYPRNGDYRVFVSSDDTGKNAYVPVKDTGPWNIDDNYWDPADPSYPRPRRLFTDVQQGLPEAQAAFYNGYNTTNPCKDLNGNPTNHAGGSDQFGRCVLNPSALDLSVAAASQLGMTGSGWVTVTYMWEPTVPGYVVDDSGGIHPYGTAPGVYGNGWWPGQDMVRGIAVRPNHTSGYTLDKSGGIHSFGAAPDVTGTGWWPNQNTARGITIDPSDSSGTSGYVVDLHGGIHEFGTAPPVTTSGWWPTSDAVRGIVATGQGRGYTIDLFGGIHPFGGAPAVSVDGYWPGKDVVRGITSSGASQGYVLDLYGGIHTFGGAPPMADSGYWPGANVGRGITFGPTFQGGYVVDLYGGIHQYGAAPATIGSWYQYGYDLARGIGS